MNKKVFNKKSLTPWFHGLRPAFFSVAMLVLGAFCLLAIPQGRDAVLGVADATGWERGFFVFSALIWALQIWYWARTVYLLQHPRQVKAPSGAPAPVWLEAEVPRILGASALVSVSVALLWMDHYAENRILALMGASFLLGAAGFYFFLRRRREYFKKYLRLRSLQTMQRYAVMKTHQCRRMLYISELPPGARRLLSISTGLAAALFLIFSFFEGLSGFNSSAAVMLLCFSLWAPLGSWILYLSYKHRFHLFFSLLVAAIVFSFFNDNHSVRVLELQKPLRLSLDTRLNQFLSRFPAPTHTAEATDVSGAPTRDAQKESICIAAIEGGGIRSGYWAASLLTQLEKQDPGFHRRLLAISSVSGGSLGASVYVALLKEKRLQYITDYASAILGRDFLSPTLAMMLTGDLAQEALPIPVPVFSRALALEKAWEKAWRDSSYTRRFSQGFTSLWENDPEANLPLLFLNGIQVESGQRIITAPVQIDENVFPAAIDIYRLTWNGLDMPLSTAVHNSARFPYISPMGTLANGSHIADGGYFDNSGAATALDLLRRLRDILSANPRDVAITVIFISNDPEIDELSPLRFISGVLGPARTFFNAWKAHTQYARVALEREAKAMNAGIVHFNLMEPQSPDSREQHVKFPLGWSLSPAVQTEISRMAEKKIRNYLEKVRKTGGRITETF